MRLDGRVAIVTGASRGLGSAICLALAREGADVVLASRSPADDTVKAIRQLGRSALWSKVDVTKGGDVDRMVADALREFKKLDILVNSAGAFILGHTVDMTEDQWDFVLEVNAKGVFLCCRAVAKEMIRRNAGGKIVNMSSNAGLVGYSGYSAYCASKWAVLGFTQSLAKELAPYRINVNAICPGDIDTEMLQDEVQRIAASRGISEEAVKQEKLRTIPMGRFGRPDDIAKLVVFLVSDDAAHISGDFIKVTGGK